MSISGGKGETELDKIGRLLIPFLTYFSLLLLLFRFSCRSRFIMLARNLPTIGPLPFTLDTLWVEQEQQGWNGVTLMAWSNERARLA